MATLRKLLSKAVVGMLPLSVWAVNFSNTPLNVPQTPPPNLLFSLSVEFPTAGTVAYKPAASDVLTSYGGYSAPGSGAMINAMTAYNSAQVYDGYFDSSKCYTYIYTGTGSLLTDEYFSPAGYSPDVGNNYSCENGASRAWNGNFLNWLTTSSLDIFRKYLTGGARDVDSPTLTRLVRSWIDGRASELNFMDVWLDPTIVTRYTAITPSSKAYIVARAAPSAWGQGGLAYGHPGWYWGCRFNCNNPEPYGDRMRIIDPTNTATESSGFNWATMPRIRFPRLSVAVCNGSSNKENNCQAYYKSGSTQYYKPIGLIQQYQSKARFGAFSYVNVDMPEHHAGGVMRSPLKSVNGSTADSNNEIDPSTGVFIYDPENLTGGRSSSVVQPIGMKNSGLINYINQFGSIAGPSGWRYVQGDVIGELFYETLRYLALPYTTFENQTAGATPEYVKDVTTSAPFQSMNTDGFPIFTTFKDPMLNACQSSAVVFIGDTNQNCDGRIPGGVYSPVTDGPRADGACSKFTPTNAVPGLNVKDWINLMGAYEGGQNSLYSDLINSDILRCPEGESGNDLVSRGCWNDITPNISGLAFWAHVGDIRSDLTGRQSVDTFIIDVHEQYSPGRTQNSASLPFGQDPTPYWLAAKYGGFKYDGANMNPNSDKTSWDSNNDNVPDNFLGADTPSSIKNGLQNIFNKVVTGLTRQGNGRIALSTPVNAQNTQIYKTYYTNNGSNMWEGNIVKTQAYSYFHNGAPIGYYTGQATGFDQHAAGWLKDNTVAGNPRQIITATRNYAGGPISGSPFQWSNLSTYTQNKLLNVGETTDQGSQKLSYLRGDRSLEISTTNPNGFRTRPISVLGDIIDSSPVFVGPAQAGYSDSDFPVGTISYSAFSQAMANRRPMVYVGANDGMLHGFDGNMLNEVFAFIPNSVLSKLKKLSDPGYQHDYFVNETPIIAEVPISGRWTTQLIGFPGIGGSGLFALDITSPDSVRPDVNLSNAESQAGNIVMWELNSETDSDIGNILNRGQLNRQHNISMQVGRMSNGRWAIVSGNGYNSPNNSTGLIVAYLDASGGTPSYKKIMISGAVGGLSTPTPIDIDFDGKIDYAYAGDLQGNVWRFDLRGNENTWSAFLLFTTSDRQFPSPITTAPAISFHCSQPGLIINIGTGKYLESGDNNSAYADSHWDFLFGLWDQFNNTPITWNQLTQQWYFASGDITNPNTDAPIVARSLITTSDNAVDWQGGQRGWVLPLWDNYPRPARIVVPPYIMNGMLYFNTTTPDFPSCGEGNMWATSQAVQACTGGRPNRGVFDINFDGVVDNKDQVDHWGDLVHVTGVNIQDQARVFDSSVWISPKAINCNTAACASVNIALSDPIGINLMQAAPRRLSWREVVQH